MPGNTTQTVQKWDDWRKRNILFPLQFKINTLFRTKQVHTNEDVCELVQWRAISLSSFQQIRLSHSAITYNS